MIINNNLKKAKQILTVGNYTCVLYDGINEYTSTQKGVRPLIEFINSKTNFNGYFAADKVVGAGAAHLYVLLGVKAVWANVISTAAKKILKINNIQVFFENEVPHIINRAGNGICPIELCVNGITNSSDAFKAITKRLKELDTN